MNWCKGGMAGRVAGLAPVCMALIGGQYLLGTPSFSSPKLLGPVNSRSPRNSRALFSCFLPVPRPLSFWPRSSCGQRVSGGGGASPLGASKTG